MVCLVVVVMCGVCGLRLSDAKPTPPLYDDNIISPLPFKGGAVVVPDVLVAVSMSVLICS